ncbi:hypothetical protein QVD17_04379 [Tagetes erecta]|uniref:Uncharacterized protein n=1 Tax=Tagetes erecta TaxID=13708 RepID=A0AAD8P4E2_TARER|nr:hypothetical protein QVD17_04379 [Tagetes erecta]
MGNCLFGGPSDNDRIIKVINSTGGIMEFYSPITAECITDEFPGHAIFRGTDLFWKPVPHQEVLLVGNSYYLLPLDKTRGTTKVGHIRSNSLPANAAAPYRMSFDSRRLFKRSYTDSSSSSKNNGSGFWKVKLVISPEQLLEILSQEGRTQELIENVRTVAKCGNEGGGAVSTCNSSSVLSDQWSLCSSSRNGSKKDVVLEM